MRLLFSKSNLQSNLSILDAVWDLVKLRSGERDSKAPTTKGTKVHEGIGSGG